MANSYLTISMITYEMLMVLHNNLIAGKKVTRTYEKQFARAGAKIGNTLQIRKPPRYVVADGAAFVPQDYADEYVSLTVDQHKQIGVPFANDDLTLSMDDFSGRFLKPALVPLANAVDRFILGKFGEVWNATGTPGTPAATDLPFLDAKTLLVNNAAPMGPNDSPMIVTPNVDARLSSGLAGRFNPQKDISGLYLEGSMGPALGWDFYDSQNMPTHVTGNFAGTPLVDGAGQTGSTINLKGWTATTTTIKKNDILQFDGSFMVNPITKGNTGQLQNFVVGADQTADGGGLMAAVQITPPLTVVGKDQTVSASPADGATVYVWGTATVANVANKTSPQCMGWQKEAISLACVDLYMPGAGEGVKAMRVSDDDLGLSFLYMQGFGIKDYERISRLDILFGCVYCRPEHVARVAA